MFHAQYGASCAVKSVRCVLCTHVRLYMYTLLYFGKYFDFTCVMGRYWECPGTGLERRKASGQRRASLLVGRLCTPLGAGPYQEYSKRKCRLLLPFYVCYTDDSLPGRPPRRRAGSPALHSLVAGAVGACSSGSPLPSRVGTWPCAGKWEWRGRDTRGASGGEPQRSNLCSWTVCLPSTAPGPCLCTSE